MDTLQFQKNDYEAFYFFKEDCNYVLVTDREFTVQKAIIAELIFLSKTHENLRKIPTLIEVTHVY